MITFSGRLTLILGPLRLFVTLFLWQLSSFPPISNYHNASACCTIFFYSLYYFYCVFIVFSYIFVFFIRLLLNMSRSGLTTKSIEKMYYIVIFIFSGKLSLFLGPLRFFLFVHFYIYNKYKYNNIYHSELIFPAFSSV